MIRVINGDTRSLDTKPYIIGLIKGDTRGLDYSSDVVLCFRGCQGRGRRTSNCVAHWGPNLLWKGT